MPSSVADDLNAAQILEGYKASHTPGTVAYIVEASGETRFVRVYAGAEPRSIGQWIMNADDIAGLTAQQIKDRFALPELPTSICDVTVPTGRSMQISIANGIPDWGSGGGIQYYLVDGNLPPRYYTNQRALP